jgi:alanine racemase
MEKLMQIDDSAKKMKTRARVHLKIDTGMERIGVHHYHAGPFLETAARCSYLHVEGIFSHFANSDAGDLTHARMQLSRFREVLDLYQRKGIRPPSIRHMANSGAILQLPESYMDMVRPGLLLYGVYPSSDIPRNLKVQPALTWKSRVVYFKVIEKDRPVGYGSTWKTDHPVRAVTVPVGYGDGYFRSMSHKAHVLIRGNKYPVVGNIAMDQIVVNIEQDSAYNEDPVILLGEMEGESIKAENLAEWAGTIPYEILTNINTRVPRIYKMGGRDENADHAGS